VAIRWVLQGLLFVARCCSAACEMPAAGGFENTGVAAGLNKGHVVTRFTGSDGMTKKNSKPKHRKGVRTTHATAGAAGRLPAPSGACSRAPRRRHTRSRLTRCDPAAAEPGAEACAVHP
jgi:hypothetical protein